MNDLRISLVQGDTRWHDPAGNRDYYGALLAPLAGNTDLVILPETFTSGFSNDAIAQASPFMTLSYQGITSSFDGKVGVEGIKVQVPMLNDEFRIRHAELKFKSLGELLSFKERLAEGKFPEQMSVSLKGLEVDVHGAFMEMVQQEPEEADLASAWSSVACGSSRQIGVDDLLEMGYRTLETDAEFSYLFQPGAQTLALNLTADVRDMGDYRLNLSLANM